MRKHHLDRYDVNIATASSFVHSHSRSENHVVADVGRWEQAHLEEDELRNKVWRREKCEDALREKFLGLTQGF